MGPYVGLSNCFADCPSVCLSVWLNVVVIGTSLNKHLIPVHAYCVLFSDNININVINHCGNEFIWYVYAWPFWHTSAVAETNYESKIFLKNPLYTLHRLSGLFWFSQIVKLLIGVCQENSSWVRRCQLKSNCPFSKFAMTILSWLK